MNPGTVCITGASSGIGAAFARAFARQGYSLLLHGRREHLLAALCDSLSKEHGVRAGYVLAELSDPAALRSLEIRISGIEDLEILVNNAGYATVQLFDREPVDSQDALIRTHVLATVRLTHAALQGMLRRGRGAIINVSSVAGYFISPASTSYCATKAFLTTFTESLHLEVRDRGIRMQALCPGYTTSDFHKKLGYDTTQPSFQRFMSAEKVVKASLKALARGKVVCIPGWYYGAAVVGVRMVPRWLLYRMVGLGRKVGLPQRPNDTAHQ
jgi:uncharacterized protein